MTAAPPLPATGFRHTRLVVAFLLLGVTFAISIAGFGPLKKELGKDADNRLIEDAILDTRPWYTPEDAFAVFARWDRAQLDKYRRMLLGLDIAFPLAYGSLFVVLTAIAFGVRLGELHKHRRLLILPVASVLADYGENLSIVFGLIDPFIHKQPVGFLGYLAGYLTAAKWLLIASTMTVMLVGAHFTGLRAEKAEYKK
jgi:hypothetical protein